MIVPLRAGDGPPVLLRGLDRTERPLRRRDGACDPARGVGRRHRAGLFGRGPGPAAGEAEGRLRGRFDLPAL